MDNLPGLVKDYLSTPDVDIFLDEIGEIFKIERSVKEHLVAPDVGRLAETGPVQGRGVMSRLMPWALRFDNAALRVPAVRRLATHVIVYGAKELGLGKTFSMRDR